MAADTSAPHPIIVGTDHRTGPLTFRDALFIDDAAQPAFLAGLRAAGLDQALALSTCDRVEVLTFANDTAAATRSIGDALARHAGLQLDKVTPLLTTHDDSAAVRHCFAVASSLESQVIGEPHVLGQMRACHRLSRQAGSCGSDLDGLLDAAYGAAKRVRSETTVAERPVSIAAAAIQLARDLHGDLAGCTGLLLGAGEMGELIMESLIASGLMRPTIATPRPERALPVAKALEGQAAPFETLPQLLAEADITICAIGGREPLLNSTHLNAALRKRRQKPIFLIDAALPGDVDAAVNRIEGAFLYDLADLERIATAGRVGRELAARQAWTIVDEEAAAYQKNRASRAAAPAIALLRAQFETMRAEALKEAGGEAEKATRLLINRLLHAPSEAMRDLAAGAGDWDKAEQLLRQLFRLG
ncbi:MAG TPA: glutamyl-tRNA reductase [Magnetospirillaceae bacterium]|jgi:glutamyl-tRNA reductase